MRKYSRLLARHRKPDPGGRHRHPGDRLWRQQRSGAGARPLHRLRQSIGACIAPSCDGTARVVDASLPNPAFPTLGNVDGGYEVYLSEGFAHVAVLTAEDDSNNNVLTPLSAFIGRNAQ
jgi:hypothetical protein